MELAGEDTIPPFSYSRYKDGKLLFCSDPEKIEVSTEGGVLLCKGRIDESNLFTGYMITNDTPGIYVGNFVRGEKCGEGAMYHNPEFAGPAVPLYDGEWEENRLKNGFCYSLYVPVPEGGNIGKIEMDYETCRNDCRHVVDGAWMDADIVDYIIADIEFKDGIGHVIPESVERYTENSYDETNQDADAVIALRRMRKLGLKTLPLSEAPYSNFIKYEAAF